MLSARSGPFASASPRRRSRSKSWPASWSVRLAPLPAIVDVGHLRQLDIQIEVPRMELQAVCTHEHWAEVYERLVELINEHKSTLIFVNTRKLAERVAHQLSERLGPDQVLAHHGSLSHQQPAADGTVVEGRPPQGGRRHRVARTGHRHRAHRSGLPDGHAAIDRDIPAAHRPGRARSGPGAEGTPLRAVAGTN